MATILEYLFWFLIIAVLGYFAIIGILSYINKPENPQKRAREKLIKDAELNKPKTASVFRTSGDKTMSGTKRGGITGMLKYGNFWVITYKPDGFNPFKKDHIFLCPANKEHCTFDGVTFIALTSSIMSTGQFEMICDRENAAAHRLYVQDIEKGNVALEEVDILLGDFGQVVDNALRSNAEFQQKQKGGLENLLPGK